MKYIWIACMTLIVSCGGPPEAPVIEGNTSAITAGDDASKGIFEDTIITVGDGATAAPILPTTDDSTAGSTFGSETDISIGGGAGSGLTIDTGDGSAFTIGGGSGVLDSLGSGIGSGVVCDRTNRRLIQIGCNLSELLNF